MKCGKEVFLEWTQLTTYLRHYCVNYNDYILLCDLYKSIDICVVDLSVK